MAKKQLKKTVNPQWESFKKWRKQDDAIASQIYAAILMNWMPLSEVERMSNYDMRRNLESRLREVKQLDCPRATFLNWLAPALFKQHASLDEQFLEQLKSFIGADMGVITRGYDDPQTMVAKLKLAIGRALDLKPMEVDEKFSEKCDVELIVQAIRRHSRPPDGGATPRSKRRSKRRRTHTWTTARLRDAHQKQKKGETLLQIAGWEWEHRKQMNSKARQVTPQAVATALCRYHKRMGISKKT